MRPTAVCPMNERSRTIAAVYLSGFLQGVALILFPAAGPLFTDPAVFALTSSEFGLLFTPQILAAIAASVLAAGAARQWSMKQVLLGGLAANAAAMAVLAVSALFVQGALAFVLLLLATTAVGTGFGLTLTALNAYAFDLFPRRSDAAVTGLHVLTGLGQGGASLVLALFLSLGFWWGAPVAVAGALVAMMGFQFRLTLRLASEAMPTARPARSERLLPRIWVYVVVVFLYGVCEATFGNWSPIYLEQDAGLSMAQASLGLTVFWSMVTVGRVLFTLGTRWFRPQLVYVPAPFVLGTVFLVLPTLNGALANLVGLGVAGLALSFFFPLSISLASGEAPEQVAKISGAMVAAIMLGTGFSANAVGLAREVLGLPVIMRFSSLFAWLMGALVLYLVLTQRSRHPVTEVLA